MKVWQQLLALGVFVKDEQATQMLAGQCFWQQQLREPWLPDVMCAAMAIGCAGLAGGYTGGVASSTHLSSAAAVTSAVGSVAQDRQQQQQLQQQQHHTTNAAHQEHPVQQEVQLTEPGLQQLLQLQGQEQQVFSEQCLQQVAGLMAAATRGTAATTFMDGWGSCLDTRTGSPTLVAAAALQLLRSKTDPQALQLLRTTLERMEAMVLGMPNQAAAVGWLSELLQIAVTATNPDACALLCSRQLCQHLPLRHVANMLILAIQLLQSSTVSQHQQRMLVMQHVCRLFSSLAVASVQADASSSSAMATRACVWQVLAFAMRDGDALQELLTLIPVQDKLLSSSDLYTLQLSALHTLSSPSIMRLLCGLQLSWHSDASPALMPVSLSKLHHLMRLAIGAASYGMVGVRLCSCWPRGSQVLTTLRAAMHHI